MQNLCINTPNFMHKTFAFIHFARFYMTDQRDMRSASVFIQKYA